MKKRKDATVTLPRSRAFCVTTAAEASRLRFFVRPADRLLALMAEPTICSVELFLQCLVAVPFDEIVRATNTPPKNRLRRALYDQRFWWHWSAAWTDASFWEINCGITEQYPTTPLTSFVQHPLDRIVGYYLYRRSLRLVIDQSTGRTAAVSICPEYAGALYQCVWKYDFLPGLATLLLNGLCLLFEQDPVPDSHISYFRDCLDSPSFDRIIESLDDLLDYLGIPSGVFKKYPAHVLVLAGWVCLELGKYVQDEKRKIYYTCAYKLLHLAQGLYIDNRLSTIMQAGDQVFQLNLNSFFSPNLYSFGFKKYDELQKLMHEHKMSCKKISDHTLQQLTASILNRIGYHTEGLHDGDRAPSCR